MNAGNAAFSTFFLHYSSASSGRKKQLSRLQLKKLGFCFKTMDFRTLLTVCILLFSFYAASCSAKKSKSNSNSGMPESYPKNLTHEEPSLSSELQQLRQLASQESGEIIISSTTTKKPKHHRRKNNRRNKGRGHKKHHKTNPTDILKAEDDAKVKKGSSDVLKTIPTETGAKNHRHRTRARGSRHLERGHHNHNHHKRRLRAHHNHHAKHHQQSHSQNANHHEIMPK